MSSVSALSEQRLISRSNVKWALRAPNTIPAWIAEMDFEIAPPVQAAVERVVKAQEYGYATLDGELAEARLGQAFARRMQSRFGWAVDPARVVVVSTLTQAIYGSVLAFSAPGDSVVLQLPAYPFFQAAINETGRILLPLNLRPDNGRYAHDWSEFEGPKAAQPRVMTICNPHNPTGRVFDRDELLRLCEFALAHDMVIVSDEVHADLTFDGRSHIPTATLNAEIAARTVTLTAATKSFNISGLKCAVAHFGSADLQSRFHSVIPSRLLGGSDIIGIVATIAAWDEGQPWLDDLVGLLQTARDHLATRLRKEMPAASFIPPEASYLAWIDFSGLGFRQTAFQHFLDRGVMLSAGEAFEASGREFGRLNFAASRDTLDRIIDCMVRPQP
jgi:cysteine-S-conjugate beta-lyase